MRDSLCFLPATFLCRQYWPWIFVTLWTCSDIISEYTDCFLAENQCAELVLLERWPKPQPWKIWTQQSRGSDRSSAKTLEACDQLQVRKNPKESRWVSNCHVSQLQTLSHVQLHWQLSQPCAYTSHTSHTWCTRHARYEILSFLSQFANLASLQLLQQNSFCSRGIHSRPRLSHQAIHSSSSPSFSPHWVGLCWFCPNFTCQEIKHTQSTFLLSGINISENKVHCTGQNEQTTSDNLGSTWILLLLCIAWEAYSTVLCVYKLI